jgi:hypothetical protein
MAMKVTIDIPEALRPGGKMIRKSSKKSSDSSRKTKRGATKRDAIDEAVRALDRLEPTSPKAKRIIAMLRSWWTDESGYDEEAWPALSRSLDRERARVGARKLFDV